MKPFLSDERQSQALFRWDDSALTTRIGHGSDPDIVEALDAFREAIRGDIVVLVASEADSACGSIIAHTGSRARATAIHATIALAAETREIDLQANDGTQAPVWVGSGVGALLFYPLLEEAGRQVSLLVGFDGSWTDAHDAEVMAAAERSFPMLRPYVRLWRKLEAEKRRAWELAQALDQSDIAVTILDARGLVHFANAAAERLFDDEDGLRLSFGAVVATSLRDALRLRATIDHCLHVDPAAARSAGEKETAHVLMIDRGRDRKPLVVSIAALPAQGARAPGAVLFAIRPEHDIGRFLASVCRLHGLSPVETRLACHLVSGSTIAEAAVAMRIKEQTARAYLKQVFSKTETKRQAELVRLMMSNILPMTSRLTPENVP